MNLYGLALLAAALAPVARGLFRRTRRAPPIERPRYRAMIAGAWVRFGAPVAIVLTLLWRWPVFVRTPPEFLPVQALLGADDLEPSDRLILMGAGAGGLLIGVALGLALTAWRAWRGRPEGTTLGDASALLPRSPDDYGLAALLAVTAGMTEEAYFRLLLPLLAAFAFGSALAGFVGATLLFGAMHRYQGWRGVAATTLAGAALAAAYLATGSLVATMVAHALGDVHHLVLRPALRRWIERRRGI